MTFILMWNPDISSTSLSEWRYWIQHFPFITPNWSIWDHDKATYCDDFYMVKVGSGRNGVVARGVLTSLPKKGKDWSGKGREVYYRNLQFLNIVDPEDGPMITTAQLEKAISGFGWESGHSGRVMSEEDSAKLNKLWKSFRRKNQVFFDEQDRFCDYVIEPSALAKVRNNKVWKDIHAWCTDEDGIYNETATHDCVNLSFSADYNKGVFKLSVFFGKEAVLDIRCTHIEKLKIENDNCCSWESYFYLAECGTDLLNLRSNGVEIWCKDIQFKRGKNYNGDWVPANL